MEQTQAKPIQLSFRSVQQVVVEPDDQDRFVTTAQEAARACQQVQAGEEWTKEFNRFLSYIHQWCENRSNLVDAGYVDVGDGGLRVHICLKSEHFDFDFDDEVTELDISLAAEFPMCIAEATQIPNQPALRTELSSETAILVYGDSARSSGTGGT